MEKGELSITYEAFVTDLDLGDSFTSSLIDILVKVRSQASLATSTYEHRSQYDIA